MFAALVEWYIVWPSLVANGAAGRLYGRLIFSFLLVKLLQNHVLVLHAHRILNQSSDRIFVVRVNFDYMGHSYNNA